MSYEKQTWNKYDELKTEEENIENGAVVTDNRMNHIEEGIYSHTIDISNPHKVTAAQAGLGNVQNFGIATEDEAKQGISNAKYMTPSLTQAVLSANINSIAYAYSANGTDRFTTVYPNLNLIEDGKFAKPISSKWNIDGTTISKDDITGYFKVQFNGAGSFNRTYYTAGISTIPIGQKYSVYIKAYSLESSLNIKLGSVNSSQSVTVTNNSNVPKTYKVEGLVRGDSDTFGIFGGLTTTRGTLFISEIKVEPGSVATPYIPSASEVTTADWPKYIGFSNTVKTNKSASDYTWFPIKDSELTNKVDSHVNNKANPHSVTASQVGAYSKTEADVKFATGQSLIDLSTTVKGKADDSAVVHKTGDETIGGKKTFTEEIKQKNDVDWTYIPDSSNRAEYMRRGGTVTIRWDFTSTGNFDISLGSLPTDFAPRKRIFKSIPEASATNSMHTLQINAFTGGSPGAITLFKATTNAVFLGQESFVVI